MKTIFLNFHYTDIKGSANYFKDFLLRNNYNVVSIYNPLDNYCNKKTIIYYNNNIVKEYKRENLSIVNLFIDFFISLKYIEKYDFSTFIGADNFDTLSGIFARKFLRKKIEKIIYFASDFSEDRFDNKLLNKIYYCVEKYVLKNADLVISNTYRAESKRMELGLDKENSLVISNGVLLNNAVFNNKDINKCRFVYVGSVTKEHGLYDVLSSIYSVIEEIDIIGSGDDLNRVVSFLKEKDINYHLLGNRDHGFVINFLQNFNGLGLAPYNKQEKWTYYCSPLKVSEYISCGVPVVISNVPEISDFILNNNLGIVYADIKKDNLVSKIENFDVANYDKKAEWFYSLYNQNNLYKKINI